MFFFFRVDRASFVCDPLGSAAVHDGHPQARRVSVDRGVAGAPGADRLQHVVRRHGQTHPPTETGRLRLPFLLLLSGFTTPPLLPLTPPSPSLNVFTNPPIPTRE